MYSDWHRYVCIVGDFVTIMTGKNGRENCEGRRGLKVKRGVLPAWYDVRHLAGVFHDFMPDVVGTKAHQRRRYRRKAALCSRVISLRVRRVHCSVCVPLFHARAQTHERASASNCPWYIVPADIGSYKFRRVSNAGVQPEREKPREKFDSLRTQSCCPPTLPSLLSFLPKNCFLFAEAFVSEYILLLLLHTLPVFTVIVFQYCVCPSSISPLFLEIWKNFINESYSVERGL